jgi:polyhydroxyalkanoate synthase subunit PhaC
MTSTDPNNLELAGALDMVLASPAMSTVGRFTPGKAGVRMASHLGRHPKLVVTRGRELGLELAKVVTGACSLAPAPNDRRFADAAWQDNAVLRRLLQTYLAAGRTAETLVEDADLDWRDAERMRFIVANLVEAASPSNNPILNPQAWKALIDTGGANVTRGTRNLLADMRSAPRVPTMVDESAFDVGENLGVTPGAVVLRTDVLELIQYTPQTDAVRERPVLIIPPTINKYYILDLAPGRSMVEYLVQQGQQVFVISWRNPDARHAAWNLDTYGRAILDALDAVEAITSTDRTVLTGICSGGILAALVMGHLAATGQDARVAGLGLAVTMLDQTRAGLAGALLDETTAATAVAASQARGYLDGRSLAEVFAWLRPSDLIWNYWVNNYLLGKKPPVFDILYWNADTTRMTAGLHRDFVELARTNALTGSTAMMLGSEIDLGQVQTDSYVVAGIADHICPWQACYRSTQMLGGQSRFVLSTSGHIAAMVNPPTNPKASYLVADDTPESATDWQGLATKQDGSWWPDFDEWLAERCGATKPAPAELGAATHPPLEPAPGTFVFDR